MLYIYTHVCFRRWLGLRSTTEINEAYMVNLCCEFIKKDKDWPKILAARVLLKKV